MGGGGVAPPPSLILQKCAGFHGISVVLINMYAIIL